MKDLRTEKAQKLQELNVKVIANSQCMSKHSYGRYSSMPVLDDTMFCAGK